ncbi:GlxA family transcriptional regulator [Microbacterium gorillae]|uniref:GlxA family transcriptional regulator n=1 Tax=Microbacterium gorillae TaxID=1231063 RepID=UPI003D99A49D
MSKRVVVLVLPHVNLLDLAGPVQALAAATHLGADYRLSFVSADAAAVSAQGLQLSHLGELGPVTADDLVLVPGPDLALSVDVAPVVIDWLREVADSGAEIASICTGSLILGEAGLLDGRRCTSHWSVVEHLRQRYPRAQVVDDVLFVADGKLMTSAGIASGIDLALAIIERDHGPALAASVARELVVYLRRNGAAAPRSAFVALRDHLIPEVHTVQQILSDAFTEQHTLDALARAAHVSPRTLTNKFVATIGMTPLQYQQTLRVSHAETLLSSTDLSIEAIALACGYADARQLRRIFTQSQGISPRDYRASMR